MKRITALSTLAVAAMALMIGRAFPASVMSDDRIMADVRQSYRSASLVVAGECIEKLGSGSDTRSRIHINEVIAGSAGVGDDVLVKGSYEPGREYLLYLAEGEDVNYAEDVIEYVSTSADSFVIDGDNVEYGGASISLTEFEKEMDEVSRVITAPSVNYYYGSLESLVNASENIFIGYVNSVSAAAKTTFRTQDGGSTVEKKAAAVRLSVSVYGSIKGDMSYGSTIEIVNVPSVCESMTDAETLQPRPMSPADSVALQDGATYIFFLTADPDPKQDYCFAVNPIQGWAVLDGDTLRVSEKNGALSGYSDLSALVEDINKIK